MLSLLRSSVASSQRGLVLCLMRSLLISPQNTDKKQFLLVAGAPWVGKEEDKKENG